MASNISHSAEAEPIAVARADTEPIIELINADIDLPSAPAAKRARRMSPDANGEIEEIYEQLSSGRPGSLELPKTLIAPSVPETASLRGDILLCEIEQLRQEFPTEDPNAWFLRLEEAKNPVAEAVAIKMELRQHARAINNGDYLTGEVVSDVVPDRIIVDSLLDDPDLIVKQSVPDVLNEIRQLREKFPEAPFEVCFRRLIQCDIVEIEAQRISAEFDFQLDEVVHEDIEPMDVDDGRPSVSVMPKPTTELSIGNFLTVAEREAVEDILQMFPDSDPDHVVKFLTETDFNTEKLIDEMTKGTYPKLKDRLEKQQNERRRAQFLDPNLFDIVEFLRVFPSPDEYFNDIKRSVGELYRHHAQTQLLNDFNDLDERFIRQKLQAHNSHYIPTLFAIRECLKEAKQDARARLRRKRPHPMDSLPFLPQPRLTSIPYPDKMDELFYRELQYEMNYERIQKYINDQKENRTRRIENARSKNQLQECLCCYNDDLLEEDFIFCSNGDHRYCKDCVQRHVEAIVGQGRYEISCISDECKSRFGLHILKRVLPSRLIDLLLRRCQQEEIRQAGVENMESCPFCDFSIIMDVTPEYDKLFRCQNPMCLKESCRLCKESSHVPLRCDEVEKSHETAMRVFIENRMAEALIRVCPKCNKRIVKESGCNKMTCPCGANFCYVCGQLLDRGDPYSHFDQSTASGRVRSSKTKCAVQTSLSQVHDEVTKKAGLEAQLEYLKQHPELKDINKPLIDIKKLAKSESYRKNARKGANA